MSEQSGHNRHFYIDPMRWFPASLRCLVLLAACAQAQQSPVTVPHPVPGASAETPNGERENDPEARRMMEEQAKKRNVQRQQDIVSDTDKLLELAQQLKAEVDKSNKDQLSLSVVKKAEEIEKLAKSVKEKMKGN